VFGIAQHTSLTESNNGTTHKRIDRGTLLWDARVLMSLVLSPCTKFCCVWNVVVYENL